jgi:long-subunit acyl-CoA synthetase (AMP-forming)
VMPGYLGETRVFSEGDGWVETGDTVEIKQGRGELNWSAQGLH